MHRTNLTISVTVFTAAPPTFVPERYLPISEGTTHFVDLIQVSRGDSEVSKQIYLEGILDPRSKQFIFTDKTRNQLADLFNAAFGNSAAILRAVEHIVALNIVSELVNV